MDFFKAQESKIRETFGGELFIQKLLADDPSLLGLGDLYLRGKEKVQAFSARLDLLFESPDSKCWYEVEVQLGATNETHIIRTLEYWDNERRNHPEKEHIAVIVAERITSRFFNVISLFNRHIPIIAIQMTALEVKGNHTISFTRILDHSPQSSSPSEEDFEPADRPYWVKRTSEQTMKIVDEILEFAKEHSPSSSIKYNKGYIAIKNYGFDGRANNFISIRPGKREIRLSIHSPESASLQMQFEQHNMNAEYDEEPGIYIFYFAESGYPMVREVLRNVIDFAYKSVEISEASLVGAED